LLEKAMRATTVTPGEPARVYFNCVEVESDSSLIYLGMIFSENRFPLFGIML
jgi:hypothetical protein